MNARIPQPTQPGRANRGRVRLCPRWRHPDAHCRRVSDGLDGIAIALECAYEYVDGTVNHWIAARELDLSPLEAEIILQAFEPVAAEYADAVV